MTRLFVHVEGQTEESFVNEVLAPHLYKCGFTLVRARLMGNARQRNQRGGIRGWPAARKEIVRQLRQDSDSAVTTMVDYYGLPQSGGKGWPGRENSQQHPFPDKARLVEDALSADVSKTMGTRFDSRRFIPYLMMHEFEALLFSDCERFSKAIGKPSLAPHFERISESFESPEEIDDSPDQAPSKRIEAACPGYQKPLLGTLAALEIGLQRMRRKCPHFSGWMACLEGLPTTL